MSRKQIVEELHKPARKNFTRRHVILKGIDELWQADLVDMNALYKFNNGHKFILTVIDCFSKFAWSSPIKNKSAESVTSAMHVIFKNSNRIPKNLQTDFGKEFYNTKFKSLMDKYEINHYSTYSHLKCSIVERFNRTLKSKMWKMFSYTGKYIWIDKLNNLIDEYNKTKHRTIKMRPIDVKSKKCEQKLLKTVFNNKFRLVKNKFKIGDFVRVSKYKGSFEKGYTPNWSPELFEICCVNRKYPVTYKLRDYKNCIIAGCFYEAELQKTKNNEAFLIEKILKKNNKKVLVKWYGFDDSHNSWINKNEII